jgi:hypothetical protein
MVDVDALLPPGTGWELISAFGVSDAGQIAGSGVVDGREHAVLLTPVRPPRAAPRPAALPRTGRGGPGAAPWALALAGVGTLGALGATARAFRARRGNRAQWPG